jgi:hypothetical protein
MVLRQAGEVNLVERKVVEDDENWWFLEINSSDTVMSIPHVVDHKCNKSTLRDMIQGYDGQVLHTSSYKNSDSCHITLKDGKFTFGLTIEVMNFNSNPISHKMSYTAPEQFNSVINDFLIKMLES